MGAGSVGNTKWVVGSLFWLLSTDVCYPEFLQTVLTRLPRSYHHVHQPNLFRFRDMLFRANGLRPSQATDNLYLHGAHLACRWHLPIAQSQRVVLGTRLAGATATEVVDACHELQRTLSPSMTVNLGRLRAVR